MIGLFGLFLIIVISVQNKHYLNAGASAVKSEKAVLSGILQVLVSLVLCSSKTLQWLFKNHFS
ncbi:hypothetical protein DC083_00900 [Ignatzschineria ureiclastica]|uniref:Uncharacterized protein n=1 Tax=Ignatzschineria ureiclastica TaxID=472582 RepID=A0A2U2AGJ1_9GAMM|nr:hypothetical protein DC083_00900 [Ignatzschineria ureiclastica]